MAEIQTLMDMGFDKQRVEYALKVTNNKGVEAAMEWLLAHADEDIPAETLKLTPVAPPPAAAAAGGLGLGLGLTADTAAATSEPSSTSTTNAATPTEASGDAAAGEGAAIAKSLKCDDCGKLCRDSSEVEFHAAKTGHSNFSESTEEKKPLTEEEKKAQLALIEEKLKQKRREREERERSDDLERERNRIKSGKDMTEARKRMEELEMKKILEQRKREKDEEKAARDRVRAQIEADKAARKAREQPAGAEGSKTAQSPQSPVTSTTNAAATSPLGLKTPPKDYTQTRIQVRLRDGSALQETFSVKEQLSAVRVFIQMKTGYESAFGLMTSFPRKVFGEEDYEKPLDVLGLVPSAVLIVTKGPEA